MTENELNVINDLTKCVRGISFQMIDLTSEVKEIKREVIETRAIVDIMNSKVSKKPEYLSVGEAAIRLGYSERTIRDRIKAGKIKAFKGKGEKSYQIPVKEFYMTMSQIKSIKFTR
jgi:excisionase family DNA binding protein